MTSVSEAYVAYVSSAGFAGVPCQRPRLLLTECPTIAAPKRLHPRPQSENALKKYSVSGKMMSSYLLSPKELNLKPTTPSD